METSTAPAVQRFAEQVRAAADDGTRLRIRAGGSKDFYGGPLIGEILDPREHSGVTSYEPTELVLSARCGTPLVEIESVLAARGQMIAFEPPHFGAGATLGGCIAAGLSGPRRAANGLYYGAARDFVLGCGLMDGRGEAMRFGGQVMKNVAGYDVSRLAVGSMGTLGLILDVSLKVLPVPPASATLRFALDQAEALANLHAWAGKPLPLSASAWQSGELTVRLEGAVAAVDAACAQFSAQLGGNRIDEAEAKSFWHGLREHAHPFFAQPGPLWRLSVPATAAPIVLPGAQSSAQLIEWGGALRWWIGDAKAEEVRGLGRAAGGHATMFRGGDRAAGVFTPLEPIPARLHRNLKAVFDPAGVFNHARLYPEW